VDVIGQIGQIILGRSAEELKEIIDKKDDYELKKIANEAEHIEHYFTIAPKINIYNDVRRKKYTVLRMDKIDTIIETNRMSNALKKLMKN